MPVYQEVMEPQGWRHAVRAVLLGRRLNVAMPVVVLTVHRRPGRPDFSDDDLARLGQFHRLVHPRFGACTSAPKRQRFTMR